MDHYVEDNSKQRLTDRLDIIAAINILRSEGYDHEDLIREITRIFYIDLDEYNDILAGRLKPAALLRARHGTRLVGVFEHFLFTPTPSRTFPLRSKCSSTLPTRGRVRTHFLVATNRSGAMPTGWHERISPLKQDRQLTIIGRPSLPSYLTSAGRHRRRRRMIEGKSTLDELLNDPMIQLVMARDRVRPEDVRMLLERDRKRAAERRLVPKAHVIAAVRGGTGLRLDEFMRLT